MSTEDQNARGDDLRDLLARVVEKYLTCDTYDDAGMVTELMPNENGEQAETATFFSIVFDRPKERFRFEERSFAHDTLCRGCIAWRESKSAKFWSQLRGSAEIVEDVGLALARAVGTCGGVAVEVPQLLMPQEVNARGLMDLEGLATAGEAEFNGCKCVKIIGSYPSLTQTIFWVDQKTALIVKTENFERMTIQKSERSHSIIIGAGPLMSRTITIYSPRINCPIPQSKFEFNVPR